MSISATVTNSSKVAEANNPQPHFVPLGLEEKHMIPVEAALASLAGLGTLLSALFGGGLFRQALKHNAENAVLKYQQQLTDKKTSANDLAIQALQQDLALVKKDVSAFEHHIKKLDLLPEISSKLTGIETSIQFLKEQVNRLDRVDAQNRHNNG
jgi:hypothetical protein